MKTVTKLVAASMFALSAVVPALATEPEALTLAERNTYLYTADARSTAQISQHAVRAHRGTEAMAFAPAQNGGIVHHGEFDGY